MANFLVGCDVGTSGTKAVIINENGDVLGSHSIEYELKTPRPGWAEHNPECYWDAAADTIKASIEESSIDPKDIKAVSVSGLSPACILVDENLNHLQNGHIWMDRRATNEAQLIKEKIGDERVFKLSGNPIDPYYATVKLLWEKNNRPELYNKAYKLQTAADYTTMKLTDKAVTDYSNASLIGIAFDIVNKKWDTDLIEEIGLDPELFPTPYPCEEVIGEVTKEASIKTGLASGTPVVAGTVDCNAAWIAGGATEPGDISLVMGTSGALGVMHKEPSFTEDMITLVAAANSETMYTTLAATVSCGSGMRYLRDNFGQVEKFTSSMLDLDPFEIMTMEAQDVPPGSEGLIVLPYFMGERTPVWDPLARGIIFGMSLSHGRGHLVRAMMEGATYALKHNFEKIKESGIKLNLPIVLREGGAQSPLWRQMVCDILNIEGVYMNKSKESPVGSAVGSAILAGVGVGVFNDYSVFKDSIKITDYHKPDPEKNRQYMKYYNIYKRLYEDNKKSFKLLAKATGYM
jgi:xylulokinase